MNCILCRTCCRQSMLTLMQWKAALVRQCQTACTELTILCHPHALPTARLYSDEYIVVLMCLSNSGHSIALSCRRLISLQKVLRPDLIKLYVAFTLRCSLPLIKTATWTCLTGGVNIGEGCTIGAGAVVTKDVPAFSVAVGNPARVIKEVKPGYVNPKDRP